MANVHPTAIVAPGAELADDVAIGAYAVVGAEVRVGAGTTIGPHCVIEGRTTIGRDNRIFQFCSLGAVPQDKQYRGGLTGIHQFVKIGAHAMAGFASAVTQDVPPFMLVDGNPLAVRGFNAEGLRRRGFGAERIAAVKQMHRLIYRSGKTLEQARADIQALAEATPEATEDVELMLAFLAQSTRGIAR